MFMLKSFLAIAVATFLIWGIWNEEVLARYEEKLFEKIARAFSPKERHLVVPQSVVEKGVASREFYDIAVDGDHCA